MPDRPVFVMRESGLITSVDNDDEVLAKWQDGNPLTDDWQPQWREGVGRIVTWSGNMGDDLFASHPATWLAPGHQALHAFCEAIMRALQGRRCTLCFLPHRRHVLSDPHSCAHFLNERADGPFEIALTPHAFIESSMLEDIEDHFTRTFQILGERCTMVIAADLKPADPGSAGVAALEGVSLGEGILNPRTYRSLLDDCVPPDVPLVFRYAINEASIAAQRDWLFGS